MEFLPGLNIITDDDRGSGKSTILRAVVQAIHPSARMEYPASPAYGHPEGDISVELMFPNIKLRIADSQGAPLAPAIGESEGLFNLKLLRSRIETAPSNAAILVEDEITSTLDSRAYAEAAALLSAARCQVICIMSAHRLDPNRFSQARIYACSWNRENDSAQIRLHQPGGAVG